MRQNSAALLIVSAVLAVTAAHAQVPSSFTPDLSHYDCSRVGAAQVALQSRHIGQVIAGSYVEWREYVTTDDPPRLVCIQQLRPDSRQLDAAAAAAHLKASAAIGAPNPERGQSLETPPSSTGEIENDVPPMPLPRAVAPSAGVERSQSFRPNGFAPVSRRVETAAPTAPSSARVSPPASIERQQAVGFDDRTSITPQTSSTHPYNTVGMLVITFPNGARYRCTGVLASAYVVLTTGHCIHNNYDGGFATQVAFYPGQTQSFFGPTTTPYGFKTNPSHVLTTQGWMDRSGPDNHPPTDYQYDIAAVQYATPFTYTSTFMPVAYNDATLTAHNIGYPAVVQQSSQQGQWYVSGEETEESQTLLRPSGVRAFALDATGGQSGSPFHVIDPVSGTPRLTGALSYGNDLDDLAGGPWYGGTNYGLLSEWLAFMSSSGPPTGVIANSALGLRVPMVFDSTQSTSASFLRFFNTSSAPTTVEVTLASHDDGALRATWTSPPIPMNASRQFDIATIENEATGGTLVKRGYYTISVRAHFAGYFQHVLWRRADGTIANVTACDTRVTSDPTMLMNVHSSLLSASYPATIVLHNTATTNVSVDLGIYDATTGATLGHYNTPAIPPNGQIVRTIAEIESGAEITATGDRYHYNIRAVTGFTGTLQYLVTNLASGTVTDMSTFCTLTAQ